MLDNIISHDIVSSCKVTIIWARQSGTSAEGVNHRLRVQAVIGPTWKSGGAL